MRRLVAFETALGRCALTWTNVGINGVMLPCVRTAGLPSGDAAAVPPPARTAVDGIVAVLDGRGSDLGGITLDERGIDPFRRKVYAATREIPAGSTATYGEIARRLGLNNGARDVGAALAANPFPIIVPCHRVIAADGALTGFSAPGGLATKRRMLELEGAPGFGQQVLFG